MTGILKFALTLLVGVIFILLIGSIFQGTWDIPKWPEEARNKAGLFCIIWGFISVFLIEH